MAGSKKKKTKKTKKKATTTKQTSQAKSAPRGPATKKVPKRAKKAPPARRAVAVPTPAPRRAPASNAVHAPSARTFADKVRDCAAGTGVWFITAGSVEHAAIQRRGADGTVVILTDAGATEVVPVSNLFETADDARAARY